jgi:hypothetical protein
MVVRHDPEPGDKFLGARLTAAINASGCQPKPVADPRTLGLYTSTTEEDLVRHIKRGLCRAYAQGK